MKEGFSQYLPPSEGDIDKLLDEGVVVLDTNVLFALYRQTSEGREQLFGVLETIGDRLWLPNHVAFEYFRRRPGVIAETNKAGAPLSKSLSELKQGTTTALEAHLRSRRAQKNLFQSATEVVNNAFNLVDAWVSSLDTDPTASISDDPILERLESLFGDRVGNESSPMEMEKWKVEADLRREKRIPPGYKDASKEQNAAGDLIIWMQMLQHAKVSQLPMLSVTDDRKEDRYWQEQGETFGPRPELVVEFAEHSSERFWQLTLEGLLHHAQRHWNTETGAIVMTPQDSTDDTETFERQIPMAMWDPDSYFAILERLEQEGYADQAAVIKAAAQAGGFVPRSQVFELIGRSPDRKLVRFALPAVRMAAEVAGEVAKMAKPLQAYYSRSGPALGYEVPAEFYFFERNLVHEWVEWDGQTDPHPLRPAD